MFRIIFAAFFLAAPNHTAAGCRASRFGNNGMLALVVAIIVKINHHPVFDAIQLVSALGIRI